ncbi:hypothetical protein HYH03_013822 [Edaphochlamys debaryana]|uniref:Uncharacterized protein n=1 Tax=Edaphochlamys debaryana TaxID=47281 RepID=A0A836BU38_9CHLO|nr:hypothetical protein HYH03_013822 [Edaphochlamys debaryana]|eukprot:KAG2487543.1 hypothetical protein HYH03_013822 [Edaphochlamys debaryana]
MRPTAEHLLRSRPPPFIAAPSYDQLCNQNRDAHKQYTCGSIWPPGVPAPAATGATTNQYIAGLDGPTLDQVVQQQDLPISLEGAGPTFVALSKQKQRAASPRRRGGHHGGREGAEGGGGRRRRRGWTGRAAALGVLLLLGTVVSGTPRSLMVRGVGDHRVSGAALRTGAVGHRQLLQGDEGNEMPQDIPAPTYGAYSPPPPAYGSYGAYPSPPPPSYGSYGAYPSLPPSYGNGPAYPPAPAYAVSTEPTPVRRLAQSVLPILTEGAYGGYPSPSPAYGSYASPPPPSYGSYGAYPAPPPSYGYGPVYPPATYGASHSTAPAPPAPLRPARRLAQSVVAVSMTGAYGGYPSPPAYGSYAPPPPYGSYGSYPSPPAYGAYPSPPPYYA